MSSSPPSIYFPDSVRFDMTFRPARDWSTLLRPGPTGRRQARKRWARGKRRMHAGSFSSIEHGSIHNAGEFGNNDPGTGGVKLTDEDMFALTMQPFLDQLSGQYMPFWIFDPRERSFYQVHFGEWNGAGIPLPLNYPADLPLVLPFRGPQPGLADPQLPEIVSLFYVPAGGGSPTEVDPADCTFDQGGGGLETRIESIDVDPPADGEYDWYVSLKSARERIPAVMLSDVEDLSFDTEMDDPWQDFHFDAEEYFG